MILGIVRKRITLCFFLILFCRAQGVSSSTEVLSNEAIQEQKVLSVVHNIDAIIGSESELEHVFINRDPQFFILQRDVLENILVSQALSPRLNQAVCVLCKKLNIVCELVSSGVRDPQEVNVLLMIVIKPYFEIGMGDEWVQPYFDAIFELNGVLQFIKQSAHQTVPQKNELRQSVDLTTYYEQLFTLPDGLAFLLDKRSDEIPVFFEDVLRNNSLVRDLSDEAVQKTAVDFSDNVKGIYQKVLCDLIHARDALRAAVERFQEKTSQLMESGALEQADFFKKMLEPSFLADACFKQKDFRDASDEMLCFFSLIQKNYSKLVHNSSDVKAITAKTASLLEHLDAYRTASLRVRFSLYRYLSALGNKHFTKILLKENVIFLIKFLENTFIKDALNRKRTYVDRAIRMLSQALTSSISRKRLSLQEIDDIETAISFLRCEVNDAGKAELEKNRIKAVVLFNNIACLFEEEKETSFNDGIFLVKDFLKSEFCKKLTDLLFHGEVIQKWLTKDEHSAAKYIDNTLANLKEIHVSFSSLEAMSLGSA